MGTDKRERQRAGRLARSEAELAAARRARTRRTAIRVVIGVAVVLGLLFGYSALRGGDDDSSETATTGATATTATTATTSPTTTVTYSNPELAAEVLDRDPPNPEPPPEDTAADALDVSTLIEGQGDGAVAGDTVTVHYVGKVPDGTVFDSSWERGQPYPVENIGQAQVIAGWNEGLIGAKIGERRRLVIGADKAYGAEGRPPTIMPNTPLAFEIDVVDITHAGAGSPSASLPAG